MCILLLCLHSEEAESDDIGNVLAAALGDDDHSHTDLLHESLTST